MPVKVGGIPAGTHVPQREFTVQVMQTRLQVNIRLAGRRFHVGVGVVERTLDDDVHALHGVHETSVAAKIHHRVVVNGKAKIVLNRRLDQSRPTARITGLDPSQIRRVDLIQPPGGNPGVVIAGDGDKANRRHVGENRGDQQHIGAGDRLARSPVAPQQQQVDRALGLRDERHRRGLRQWGSDDIRAR